MKFLILLASIHLGPGADEYTNRTPGIGIQLENGITALAYRNSIERDSYGVYYDTKWPSEKGRFIVGVASGYPGEDHVKMLRYPWNDYQYKDHIPMFGYFRTFEVMEREFFIGGLAPGIISLGVEF